VGYRYLFFSAFIVVVIVGLVEMGVGSFLAFRVRQSAELPPGVNSVTAVQVPTLPQKKKPSMKMSPEMGQVALIKSGLRDETAVPRPTAPGSALATPTEGPVLPQAEIPPPPSSVVGGGSVKIIPLVVEPGPMPVTVPHVKPDSSMAVSDMPEVLLRPQPEYPQGAVRHHIEGAVSVEIVVGHDGSVISVLGVTHHLAEGPLRRSFDDAAIKAAKGMKFVPVVDRLGRPTTLACIVSVEFRLPS
jgi:TonB family protein